MRSYQYFSYVGWPGGLFVSPGVLGTRGGYLYFKLTEIGGPIAAAWAALVCIGRNGYKKIAEEVMQTTTWIQNEVNQIPGKDNNNNIQGLKILGKPHMSVLSFATSQPNINIFAVADLMEQKGWTMERQCNPGM